FAAPLVRPRAPHAHEPLLARGPEGDDEAPAHGQLLGERRGQLPPGGGDEDGGVGGAGGPAERAVAHVHGHVAVPERGGGGRRGGGRAGVGAVARPRGGRRGGGGGGPPGEPGRRGGGGCRGGRRAGWPRRRRSPNRCPPRGAGRPAAARGPGA